jgi:hypothetical protein
MASERSRYGLVISASGAILLAVSVFLPWYGLSFTTAGIAFVQQTGDQLAAQYGNAALQGYVAAQHASVSGLAGHEFAAVSAHEVLKNLNIVLLVLAGLALLDALIPLASSSDSAPGGGGAAVLPLGGIACACVVYRIVHPPSPAGELLALSLREGAWLALLGSSAIVAGGLWPRRPREVPTADPAAEDPWVVLSGWTPQS